MKNFLQNLLMVFALCLCGLCIRQWYSQTVQRNKLGEQGQEIFDRDTAIQGYTNTIQTQDHQIALLDKQVSQLNQSLITNSQTLLTNQHDIARLKSDNDLLSNAVVQYTNDLAILESRLTNAYAGITTLTNDLAHVVIERDSWLTNYNSIVSNYNLLGSNYSVVVDRLNKLQSSTK
jgi:chromosome segregation ATPase